MILNTKRQWNILWTHKIHPYLVCARALGWFCVCVCSSENVTARYRKWPIFRIHKSLQLLTKNACLLLGPKPLSWLNADLRINPPQRKCDWISRITLAPWMYSEFLLRFVRTRVLISRSRLNNRATMEADILSVTRILTPEAASVTPCFPFDITISLRWFPLLYLHYTTLWRRGWGTSSWFPSTACYRLFCCRTLRRSELCCDSQEASTQGTVEQSRMQTGSHQTRQICAESPYVRRGAVLVFTTQLEN